MEGIYIDNIELLESQLRQLFASVVWTHKIQEKQSDIYSKQHKCLEFWRILLSALTSSGIFAVIFVDEIWLKIITAIVSSISLFISTYFKTYDLKLLQKEHKKSALAFLELREELVSVLCDIKMNKYIEDELFKKRDDLIKRKIKIANNTLDASEKAVDKASEDLKIRKDNTYSDEEIDSFLPLLARKNKN